MEGLLRAIRGLPASETDATLIRQCTGRSVLPTEPAAEIFCICGRRAGKSQLAALLAVYFACFRTCRKRVVND